VESVSISPDGKAGAVDFVKGKTSHIYLIAMDTGNATRLTHANTGAESNLTFSPDGKHIAYTYLPEDGAASRIVVGNADGSDLHEWSGSRGKVRDFSLVFSPDNKTMIFARSGRSRSHIITRGISMRLTWTAQTFVSLPTRVSIWLRNSPYRPMARAWWLSRKVLMLLSRLPFIRWTIQKNRCKYFGLKSVTKVYITVPITCLTGTASFSWLPVTENMGTTTACRLDLRTGAIERLTKGNGYATELKVSADGKTAAFLKWRKNWIGEISDAEIYLLDLESRKLTPLKVSGLN
jgi:Tol biopolymer transport system component